MQRMSIKDVWALGKEYGIQEFTGLKKHDLIFQIIRHNRLPWISLTLAFSFGMYGLMKKMANMSSTHSLLIETAALAPFALALMTMWHGNGQAAFALGGWQTSLLLPFL